MNLSKSFFRTSLVLAFFMLLKMNTFADSLDSLELKGMVFNDNERVKDAVVNIYDHNKLFKRIDVRASNQFVTNLPLNTILTIEITAPGFHTKRFVMDTTVPGRLKESQLKYDFDMDIFSEEELANINTSFLDFPVGLVSYDHRKKVFHRNKKYTKRMKKAYLKLWAESQAAARQGQGLK